MVKKVVVQLFPRNRYAGASVARTYFVANRERVQKELGGASSVLIHARVYDRAASGSPSVSFDFYTGSFGAEYPAQGLRQFTATVASDVPTLPWNSTNMTSVPDDGTFVVTPGMGLLDPAMRVSGSASTWIELEVWATVVYA